MSNGKFSKPRPYRDEEREIEHAFRQLTGQEPAAPPQPQAEPVDLGPLPEDFVPEDLLQDTPAPEEPSRPVQIPVQPIPDDFDFEPEEADDEPDFIDKLQFYFRKAVDFCGKNPKMMMVGLCAVALVLILGFMAAFFFSSSDPYGGKILPNVHIASVNVGGLTKSEAVSAVKQATALSYSQQDMVIDLSGTELRLRPADTGVSLDVKAAVNAAYDYGRTGSKAEQEQTYLDALSGKHYIGLLPYLKLNQDHILQVLSSYAQDTGSTLKQTNYGLEGDQPKLNAKDFDEKAPCQTLVINMGTPGIGFDPQDVFKQVLDAYSLHLFRVEVQGVNSVAEPDPIDLDAIYEEFYIEPVNAAIDMQTFETIPGSYGYGFDLEQARKLLDGAGYGDEIRIPMEYIEPEILDEDVFFRDVLGAYETRHTSDRDRTTNLELACKALNGLILNPGEEFSYNKALGERTAARGYKKAPAYSGLELVDTYGGGVCQGSSTLYYCALLADLTITERTNHGFVPTYTDYGMDATVSWGGPDFRFLNSTNYPIRIEAEVSGGYVKMQILGTDEKDYYVKMDYQITDTYKPKTEYRDFDYDNKEGYEDGDVIEEGVTGYNVKTYKIKYDKETNALLSRDYEANSRYTTVNKVIARVEEDVTEPPTTEATEPEETEPPTAPPTTAPTVPTEPEITEPETEPATEPATDPTAAPPLEPDAGLEDEAA